MKLHFFEDNHLPIATDLFTELYSYYNDDTSEHDVIRSHLETLTSDDFPMKILLATDDNQAIGMAAFYLINSLVEPDNVQCQMKEIFVSKDYRNKGIGMTLMECVIDYAKGEGCRRMDWHVKANNEEGRRFYERLGAKHVSNRMSYRLSLT